MVTGELYPLTATLNLGPPTVQDRSLENQLTIVPQCQGLTNACGTTALSVVLNALDRPVSREVLDRKIRRRDSFTAPGLLVRAARSHGLSAQLYNQCDLLQIEHHLSVGHGLIVLYQPARNYVHYEVVAGVERQNSQRPRLILTDASVGRFQRLDWDDFDQQWGSVGFWGIPTGYRRFMMVLSRHEDLPAPKHGPTLVNALATGLNRLLNFGR